MIPNRLPLGKRTADQLLGNAVELEGMAATASTEQVKRSLQRLADRYRALAETRRAEAADWTQAGDPAG